MDNQKPKILKISILLIIVSFCLFTLTAHATYRGIVVETRTSSGSIKNIRLYSDYYALVIGCGNYREGWPHLPNPVKDAREVGLTLKDLGWNVDVIEDPDGATLRKELIKLVTGPGRNKEKAILVWFSGHGQTIEEADGTKLGYLVPVDAPDPDKDLLGFMERAVSMRQIETVSKQIMSKHVLMAFDSCFSGAIFQMVRAKPSAYIQEKVSYPVRQFITAGNENEKVPDKSVFKNIFIQALKDGFADLNRDNYVTGEELGSYLQEKVINYSHKTQHPQFGKINNPKLDKGDFVFLLESSKSAVASHAETDKTDTALDAERKRIERERLELEKMKVEIERKKLEIEKKRYEEDKKRISTVSDMPTSYISSLDAMVTELRLFESGYNADPRDQRKYKQSFQSSKTRYIHWELNLSFPKSNQIKNFTIHAIYYNSDGSVKAKQAKHAHIESGWTWFSQTFGWGSKNKTAWKPGDYRLDIFIQGQKVASKQFTVF